MFKSKGFAGGVESLRGQTRTHLLRSPCVLPLLVILIDEGRLQPPPPVLALRIRHGLQFGLLALHLLKPNTRKGRKGARCVTKLDARLVAWVSGSQVGGKTDHSSPAQTWRATPAVPAILTVPGGLPPAC